ncbi:MAG TPA: low-specificity L-threonine aldolase [Thermodesulfobacteriota bacterium]|nr:low-specificity L-threonine aldolase [Thermodesulfobacteriota bacterium]
MKDYIDLRSDTVTKPTIAMRKAMAEAEVGDDVYGEDPTVNVLQQKVADLLGKEASLFVPSGTMANQLSIKSHTEPGDEVIIESSAHPYNFEGGAGAALSGIQFQCLKGLRGILDASQVEENIRPADHHFAITRLVCLENTHNRGGGSIYPLEKMAEIYRLAKSKKLLVHLDGARLWNASVAARIKPREYAQWADSVSVCLSKGLGAPIGSLVAGSKEFINRAHRFRKMFGGGMRQAGIIAAAGIYALDHHIERLKEDHQNAKRLAVGLKEFEGVSIEPKHVETNIVIFDVANTGMTAAEVGEAMRNQNVLVHAFGKTQIRLVTHLDVSADEIVSVLKAFRKVFIKKR